ncbi:MAG: phage portal protein [Hyphomicrobiaceae bacterium]
MSDDNPSRESEITAAIERVREQYRDAEALRGGEISMWRPGLRSADTAVLRNGPMLRARARDLVRNDPYAKNAVRMNRDAVSGSGLKLALKIDWRTLGLKNIEAAAEWQDFVSRAWEAFAESLEFQADARRQMTFSQLFALADSTDFVDGESLAVIEMKPGVGIYQTCLNLVDIDRLGNPEGMPDQHSIRGGIERDVYGEPIAYHIREGHPADVGLGLDSFVWRRVLRTTPWGRPIVLHTYDQTRPEMTRGVTEFASAIVPMRQLRDYTDTELQTATVQAAYAAVIKTELDYAGAMQVVGAQVRSSGSGNPLWDMTAAHMINAAEYAKSRELTFMGSKIPHLLPNESLELMRSSHPNSNFADFEKAFVRQLAAGLGVEAHELAKNYTDVNYSAARAALLSVWRTYRARRNRNISGFAMPFFGAWLEEAIAIDAVPLPPGVSDFLSARPYLVRGTFIAWGKPMIDPLKERQAQQLGMQMGVETMEEICAEEGQSWRDNLDQLAYERRYREHLGLPDPNTGAPVIQTDPNTDQQD